MLRTVFLCLGLAACAKTTAPVPPVERAEGPSAALTGRKVALVIGNGKYQHTARLPQAPVDADVVAEALGDLGYEVQRYRDLERADFVRALADFQGVLRGADVGFFYYAGHALQVGGANYMVPVEAELSGRAYVDADAVDARKVLQAMDQGGSKLNIVALDACRDNPWAGRWEASDRGLEPAGLAEISVPRGKGFLLAFATDPGDVAADSGLYASSMVEHLSTPCVSVVRALGRVRDDVERRTDGDQRPWLNVGAGEVAFRYLPAGCTPPLAAPAEGATLDAEADRLRREAQQHRVALQARVLATEADHLLEKGEGDMHSRGALLAVEALRRGRSTQATAALHRALEERRRVLWQAPGGGLGPGAFVAFSPDGAAVAAVGESHDTPGRVLDATTGAVNATLSPAPTRVAWGTSIAGATESAVVLWDASGQELRRLDHGDVQALAFDAAGARLATASGATIRVWNVADGALVTELIRSIDADYPEASSVAWHPTEDRLVAVVSTGDPDDPQSHRVEVWDVSRSTSLRQISFEGPVGGARYSTDGHVLAVGVRGTVRFLDAATFEPRGRVGTDEARDMVSLAWAGDRVAAVGWDAPARVWSRSAGTTLAVLEHERGAYGPGRVSALAFAPDGQRVATIGDDQLRMWSFVPESPPAAAPRRAAISLPPGFTMSGEPQAPRTVSSDDGTLTATVGAGGGLAVARSGSPLPHLARSGGVAWATFSPGGTLLVTTGDGLRFLVVEVATGTVVAHASHDRPANELLFSRDGAYLATASQADGTARIWDLTANVELLRWHLKTNLAGASIRFVDDDRFFEFVGTEYDDRVTTRAGLWRPEDLTEAVCGTVTRELTEEEWSQYLGGAPARVTCP